jgi:peptidyl-prolyl cis-trans isomerase A (cyclophilin A)
MKTLLSLVILLAVLAGCKTGNPKVVFETPYGNIEIEIYEDKASVTASNFMRYVNEDRFKDAVFYRVVTPDNQPDNNVKIEVVQGGLYEDEHPDALPPIKHETTNETGIKHLDGTISMARNEPGTASSEFFICIGDQPELDYEGKRNPDGQGFAAFGRVVKGMGVVRKIQHLPAKDQMLLKKVPIKIVKKK